MPFKKLIILFLIQLGLQPLWAYEKPPNKQDQSIFHFSQDSNDPNLANKFIATQLSNLHQNGFLNASIDSIQYTDQEQLIYISPGIEFYYVPQKKEIPEVPAGLFPYPNIFPPEPTTFSDFAARSLELLAHYARHGYPFARIDKRNVEIRNNYIYLDVNVDLGEIIVFDSIQIQGDARLNAIYLGNFLDIKSGNLYDDKLVTNAEQKLRELDFIKLTGPLQIKFAPGKASLLVPAQNNQANRFDGMAGLSGGGEQEEPLQINGTLSLYLSNAFGSGEFIDLSWQGPGNGTQILKLNGGYPYPLKLPIETEMLFSLHKQDTSWLQLQFKPAIYFTITNQSKIGAFWHYTNNSHISTPVLQQTSGLPLVMDFRVNLYGLEYRFATVAFSRELVQPGFMATITTSAGMREILNKINLPDQVFENITLRKSQFHLFSNFEKRWQTGNRATLSIGNRMAILSGDNLPQNQLIRLGGFQTLRGFDELSILASAYSLANLEFRFFTGPYSFFSLFANGGWYEQKIQNNYYNDLPLGIGTGLSLQTRSGIFSINLAMGWQKNIPPAFRNAKIHLGYISAF